jgi:putative FmdB family regulatory protein
MPTYVYECKSCNTVFEADQSIKDEPLNSCACGAIGTVKRVIQPVGISFKGSGFYVNDSKSAPAPPSSAVTAPKEESTPSPAPAETPAPAAPVASPPTEP